MVRSGVAFRLQVRMVSVKGVVMRVEKAQKQKIVWKMGVGVGVGSWVA